MSMTHYMALLADNQPWNLILFMAIPVILAETVAITELFILLDRPNRGPIPTLNRWASILGGAYFSGVFVYLSLTAAIPLTLQGGWRGPADVIAVLAYLSGVIPLSGLALVDLRWIGAGWVEQRRLRAHAFLVAFFLVVAHVAMIFGMLDPTIMWSDHSAAAVHGSPHSMMH
jgi:hypothetical protein